MEIRTYQCPSCSAPLKWGGEKLKCEACGAEFKEEDMRQLSEAMAEDEKKSSMNWSEFRKYSYFSENDVQGMQQYSCPACGATLLTGAATAATHCAYCGNNALVPEKFSGDLRPDAVIPFTVTREEAQDKLKKHFQDKYLLPDDFIRACRVEEVEGLYVPYFLFDCRADVRSSFRATRVHHRRQGNYEITSTDHFYVERAADMGFKQVPVDACKRVADTLTEAIEPFDYTQCRDFDAGYLAGFQADCRDQDMSECVPRANERVENAARNALRETVVGYTTVQNTNTTVNLRQGNVAYAMMPVWLMTVRYGDKAFPFAVNGQTGKLVGELPVDKKKYWKLLLLSSWGAMVALTLLFTLLL